MSRAAFEKHTNVSRETLERLDTYANLLSRWTKKINLVSPTTVSDLWTRHFLDSAQILNLAPRTSKNWVDLGSGGGFPGAVVAIVASESHPDLTVTLVESDQRKAAFLRSILRETGTKGMVIAARAEETRPLQADVLSARALAPLDELLAHAERHLLADGRAIFLKGKKAGDEIEQALEHWRFDCETYDSKTDDEAVILSIGEIERV